MNASSGRDASTPHRRAIRDGIDEAYTRAGEVAHGVVERTKDGLSQTRDALSGAYETSREKASDAYALAREKARDTRRSAGEGLEANPVAALLGGLVIGAAIGALLPRTERETKLLGTIGDRVRGAAGEAVDAAKEAGRDKLDELGLSREHARDTMKTLLDGVIAAAGSAGTAALQAAKTPPKR